MTSDIHLWLIISSTEFHLYFFQRSLGTKDSQQLKDTWNTFRIEQKTPQPSASSKFLKLYTILLMNEDARKPTFRDLLKAKGIDLDIARREREKADSGCVVRSLQSALSVDATEEEWNMRLGSVRSANSSYQFLPVLTALSMDIASIWTFIKTVSSHDTPLGRALREVELEDTTLKGREIKDRIADGENVCIIGGLVTNEELAGFHMAHVTLEDDTVVSKSDDGMPVELGDETDYLSLVFYPKTTSE